jgi:transcriptional regulator with XRE-family HTH domain
VTGKDRAQIARWERDAASPPFETLRALLRACGFDLSDDLITYDPTAAPAVDDYVALTPSERLDRMERERQAAS